jgi:hypothetical protein
MEECRAAQVCFLPEPIPESFSHSMVPKGPGIEHSSRGNDVGNALLPAVIDGEPAGNIPDPVDMDEIERSELTL